MQLMEDAGPSRQVPFHPRAGVYKGALLQRHAKKMVFPCVRLTCTICIMYSAVAKTQLPLKRFRMFSKYFYTNESPAIDRVVRQVAGERYLESVFSKDNGIKCHGNFRR